MLVEYACCYMLVACQYTIKNHLSGLNTDCVSVQCWPWPIVNVTWVWNCNSESCISHEFLSVNWAFTLLLFIFTFLLYVPLLGVYRIRVVFCLAVMLYACLFSTSKKYGILWSQNIVLAVFAIYMLFDIWHNIKNQLSGFNTGQRDQCFGVD